MEHEITLTVALLWLLCKYHKINHILARDHYLFKLNYVGIKLEFLTLFHSLFNIFVLNLVYESRFENLLML